MGCGASKHEDTVVTTVPVKSKGIGAQMQSTPSKNNSTLSKPVVPSIQKTVAKPVAFEISLDGLRSSEQIHTSFSSKMSLPKLTLSEKDIQAKLADTEARWKDLDDKFRKRGEKPKLRSQKNVETDLAALKRRLQEKELAAKLNREREIKKLQQKLAKQEEHAKKVLERKKALGAGSNEDLHLTWGGETEMNSDENSEIGLAGSRTGSGRSNATASTDTTDVGDNQESSIKVFMALQKLGKKLGNVTAEYGIAWFVVNQALGWITYFLIYAFLSFNGPQVIEYLSQFSFTKSAIDKIGPTGSNMTIAFALNRLGGPFRVVFTTYLMRYTAVPINLFVNPLLEKMGIPSLKPVLEDFPGIENDTSVKNDENMPILEEKSARKELSVTSRKQRLTEKAK